MVWYPALEYAEATKMSREAFSPDIGVYANTSKTVILAKTKKRAVRLAKSGKHHYFRQLRQPLPLPWAVRQRKSAGVRLVRGRAFQHDDAALD